MRVYDIYYEKKYIHIVMDYCEGGELFARIAQEQTLTEAEAGLYMKQLLSAIHHCHTHNIMHRDLKPENIMFLRAHEKSLKIIDFGVGTSFSQTKKNSLKVGSVLLPPCRSTIWLLRSSRRSTIKNATFGHLE